MIYKFKMDKEKQLSDVLQKFNRGVSRIMKVVSIIEKNNVDIEWLRSQLSLVRDTNPCLILEKCMDKFWAYNVQIMNRSDAFFLNPDVGKKFIKDDENKEWLENFVKMIRDKLPLLTDDQRTRIWDCLNAMLEATLEYRLIAH